MSSPVRAACPHSPNILNDEAWLRKLWLATLLLLVVFSMAVAYRFAVVTTTYGDLSLERIRAGLAEGIDTIPVYVSVPALAGLIAASNLGILLVTGRRRNAGLVCAAVLVLGWSYDLLTASRGTVFYMVTFLAGAAAIAFVVMREPFRFRHYLLGLLFGLLLLALLTLSLFLRSDRSVSFRTRLLFDNYVYVSGNIAALQYFLDYPPPTRLPAHYTFGAGYRILNFISRDLFRHGFLREDDYGTTHARILTLQIDLPNMPFNSAPFIAYYYADFGFFGTVLAAFMAGLLIMWIYAQALFRRNPMAIQVSGLAMTSVVLSLRETFFSDPSVWAVICGLAMEHAFLHIRRSD